MKKKVVIVQKTLPHYRRRLFELLRSTLSEHEIDLMLVYGQPSPKEALKNDTVELGWATKISNAYIQLGKHTMIWQPALPLLRGADLVIVEQASKLLLNYLLLLRHSAGIQKLAFWGHGKNFQQDHANSLAEWLKRPTTTQVHWWFAYNDLSARTIEQQGFPLERITVVNNAIDTSHIRTVSESLTAPQLSHLRDELGLTGNNVGLYVGGMYPEKRLAFLIEALSIVRQHISNFEMIFVGSGADAYLVEEAARKHSWIKYVGSKFEGERVPYYAVSKVFLMPGQVGLAILDAFALGLPTITTTNPNHSPEIDYLQNGINGIMVDHFDDPVEYAEAIVGVLKDIEKQQLLVEACRLAGQKYTIEDMAQRYANGIKTALYS